MYRRSARDIFFLSLLLVEYAYDGGAIIYYVPHVVHMHDTNYYEIREPCVGYYYTPDCTILIKNYNNHYKDIGFLPCKYVEVEYTTCIIPLRAVGITINE